jgi:hypothetical protein
VDDQTPPNDDELIGFGDWEVTIDDDDQVVLTISEVLEDGVESATFTLPPEVANQIGAGLQRMATEATS